MPCPSASQIRSHMFTGTLSGCGAGPHGQGPVGATAYPFRRLVLGSDALQVVHVIRWLQAHRFLTLAILLSLSKALSMRFVLGTACCRSALSACNFLMHQEVAMHKADFQKAMPTLAMVRSGLLSGGCVGVQGCVPFRCMHCHVAVTTESNRCACGSHALKLQAGDLHTSGLFTFCSRI